jgi:hypothetical protein
MAIRQQLDITIEDEGNRLIDTAVALREGLLGFLGDVGYSLTPGGAIGGGRCGRWITPLLTANRISPVSRVTTTGSVTFSRQRRSTISAEPGKFKA